MLSTALDRYLLVMSEGLSGGEVKDGDLPGLAEP